MQNVYLLALLAAVFLATPGQAQDHGGGGHGENRGEKQSQASGHGKGGHGGGMCESCGSGKMMMSRDRHHLVKKSGLPDNFKGVTSEIASASSDVELAKGKQLFTDNCASCHGAAGTGDGADGVNLDPAPTNIARFAKMKMAKDDYLFWTLAEGGAPVGSAMPAFKELLSEEDIWLTIAYLRQLD